MPHVGRIVGQWRRGLGAGGRICVAVAVVVAVMGAAPLSTRATSQVPFHATTFESIISATLCGTSSLCITVTGSGEATHLGTIQDSTFITVDLTSNPAPGCNTQTLDTTFTAANGDQLTLHGTGVSCATGPTTVTVMDSFVVSGGTGRFSGASGSITDTGTANLVTSTAVATFDGTISSPGSLRMP
jgi:hypothetical protein